MASTNKTSPYQLNQWVLSDKPTMADFNSDNSKINQALSDISENVSAINVRVSSGTWTPRFTSSHVASYNSRIGWYQKIGNVVTIGFFVSAYISGGSTTTGLKITDLPFQPNNYAAGGGFCTGARVDANTTFGGFFIDSAAPQNIELREVSCPASAGALNAGTMAREVSSGTIVCGGTITYTTGN